jgi:phosphatidylcholine synthase
MRRAAYLVHVYTATGVVWGFLSILAALRGDVRMALLWLVVATFVDATDGWLARAARVDRHAPRINGARLDDIVDYLTYVVAPGLLLVKAGGLPDGGWGLTAVCAMLLASALGFSRQDAKTDDHYFTGFPSYWNIVALYLLAARTSAAVNAIVVIALSVLVFVPIRYVYPSRTATLRPLTVAFCTVWGVQVLGLIWTWPDAPRWLLWSSLAFPVYYAGLSFWLSARR